ncbi:MAG: peptide deformylase [Bradymonadia bacterium]
MAVRPIRTLGDPVLRQVAAPVDPSQISGDEIQQLIDDLIETMYDANGAGLAAPQVGVPLSVAVAHSRPNARYPYKPAHPLTVFINPQLTVLGETVEAIYEGCLSVPDLRGVVPRPMHVKVDALDRHGSPFTLEARGLLAGTVQHELDHLEGLLFLDRVTDPSTFTTWANFAKFHQAAFTARAEAINLRYAETARG